MPTRTTGTREQWLEARLRLLTAEKDLTRRSDELVQQRQDLPWVLIDKQYQFDTDAGRASLPGLFKGRSQLMIYHLMFGPEYTAACPSCSSIADGLNAVQVHLANHDVMLMAVSRAPLAKLQAFKQRMGWAFPWASSFTSDFNFDFSVYFTEDQQRAGGVEYNFRREEPMRQPVAGKTPGAVCAASSGVDVPTFSRERPGLSTFVLEGGAVYHTYSAYGRGVDGIWAMYQWLDRAPFGRNEVGTGVWWRRHDEYESANQLKRLADAVV
jgi:predicted dithiol-disulfide oxidoreductase (DUF899 family)